MNKVERILTTDVLVVGGGFGGLICGLRAAEAGAQVLIADKATAGGGGGAPRAGNGIITMPKDAESVERYVEYFVRNIGDYLNNQDMVRLIASNIYDATVALKNWGVKVTTDGDDIGMFPVAGGAPWKMCGIEMDAALSLRRAAVKKGVKFREHFHVTGLLKSGGRVCGAVGYDLLDGTFHVIRAKTVVMSTGACHYKNVSMFVGCGEGIKLAWEAGAQMRNAEFGNFYEIYALDKGNTIYGTYPFIHNGKGENMWKKYVTWNAPAPTPRFNRGFVEEYLAGNGPMYVDLDEFRETMANDEEWKFMGQCYALGPQEGTEMVRIFPDKMRYVQTFDAREAEAIHMTSRPEVKLAMHGNTGCVKVDLDFKTTVPGLFVTGIDAYNGCGYSGATAQPSMQKGGGLGFAAWSAYICGPKAAGDALDLPDLPEVDRTQVEQLREAAYAPLERAQGLDPHEVIPEVQGCITPIKYNCLREERRMDEALSKLTAVRRDRIANLKAGDWHALKLCRELDAMATAGEMMLRSAKLRRESRGFHIREDYEQRDDQNWLKWIDIDNVDGEMVFSTQPVPMETYRYRPE